MTDKTLFPLFVNGENILDWLSYNNDGSLTWKKTASSKAEKNSFAGWKDKDGYFVVTFKSKKIRVARLVWFLHTGYMPKHHVDHINNVITDNRIENLREATPGQNAYNKTKQRNNTCGAKGCTFARNKYQVMITAEKKPCYVGRFNSIDEAKTAYAEASKKLHGEFSNVG